MVDNHPLQGVGRGGGGEYQGSHFMLPKLDRAKWQRYWPVGLNKKIYFS